ncbi:hypothetical protein [Paenibacillus macerans]|uniref:hypothetical protein n=1 Tax=Paenibacillus macerans TaxID=44252 RepID=UPI003D319708
MSDESKMYTVKKPFRDKETGKRYIVGSIFPVADEDRALMLVSRGYLEDVAEAQEADGEDDDPEKPDHEASSGDQDSGKQKDEPPAGGPENSEEHKPSKRGKPKAGEQVAHADNA